MMQASRDYRTQVQIQKIHRGADRSQPDITTPGPLTATEVEAAIFAVFGENRAWEPEQLDVGVILLDLTEEEWDTLEADGLWHKSNGSWLICAELP